MGNLVDVKVHRPGGTIVMQRPEVGNALSRQLVEDLEQALDDVHQEKQVRYVILAGAGNHFCTGMDLKELASRSTDNALTGLHELHQDWERVAELLIKILRYPKPLIAAVDGAALGAGWALALACDLIVAAEAAQFGSPAAHRGLVGGFTAPLLWFRGGGAIAARWLMTGEIASAAWAHAAHLVAEVAPQDQVWVVADRLGQSAAGAPRESLQMTKRLLNETIGEWLTSQLIVAAGMGATSCSTEAASEGLAAFREKRSPLWP